MPPPLGWRSSSGLCHPDSHLPGFLPFLGGRVGGSFVAWSGVHVYPHHLPPFHVLISHHSVLEFSLLVSIPVSTRLPPFLRLPPAGHYATVRCHHYLLPIHLQTHSAILPALPPFSFGTVSGSTQVATTASFLPGVGMDCFYHSLPPLRKNYTPGCTIHTFSALPFCW